MSYFATNQYTEFSGRFRTLTDFSIGPGKYGLVKCIGTCGQVMTDFVREKMADTAIKSFPHIFNPTAGSESVFSLWFDTAQFAQLAISNFRPYNKTSFSKTSLAANVLNIADGVGVCKCLAPVNFFTHAFSTLADGKYSEDVKEALEKLGKYIEEEKKHVSCILKMAKEEKISEKQILLVYAHHLFEPLLPHAELLVDKNVGGDVSRCPFCPEKKESIKSRSTSFGVQGLWHGRADIVIKHGRIQQTVIVTQGTSDCGNEPATKKQRMDAGDTDVDFCRSGLVEVKKDLHWTVMSKREQDQEPIPQLLSQTIVNAFLVAKENKQLKNFFIPSFLVTPKGVMIVMYNVPNDSLVTQVVCHPLLLLDSPDKEMDKRLVFTIWLSLNFDKFCLDKSVDVIRNFLKPCGFKKKAEKHGVFKNYEEDVDENVREDPEGDYGVYDAFLDIDAKTESWKVLTSFPQKFKG